MVVPHLMDGIPWAFLLGVPGGASFIVLNPTNLEVRVHGGASPNGRNPMDLPIGSP
ncbi:hypothetical protein DEO72_LG2g4283 [Vigna unguiculata]|uniref:Uncharacterized protein n=1 Tax=Vigna unguiculata TaxID=3917 RepID=A0A4D6L683_VIGUN|nr:hypothetical protein DEO72_LG2g4283 [Vigna unguiculata]